MNKLIRKARAIWRGLCMALILPNKRVLPYKSLSVIKESAVNPFFDADNFIFYWDANLNDGQPFEVKE